MHAASRDDLGVGAACILSAFGGPDAEGEHEEARRYVGALLIAEILHELRLIRKAHYTDG